MAESGANDASDRQFRTPAPKRNPDADSGAESDQDFDPSADMLVHDFDDEHTLDEEEALEDDDSNDEIDELQKEGEMPLEELLALYRYGPPADLEPELHNELSVNNDEDVEQAGVSSTSEASEALSAASTLHKEPFNISECAQETDVRTTVESGDSRLKRLIDSPGELASEDDEEDDDDDDDLESLTGDWRKNIQVGQDYQAEVPIDVHPYTNENDYDLGDRLLWTPGNLPDKVIQDYLKEYSLKTQSLAETCSDKNMGDGQILGKDRVENVSQKPQPDSTKISARDNERALWLLYESEYDVKLALQRLGTESSHMISSFEQMQPWAEQECRQFEEGLKAHGKDFIAIQKSRLTGRTVNELVHFYYLWKKTERHDDLVSRHRIEKKQYALNPSVTNFMNRFLDEHDLMTVATSVSSAQYPGSSHFHSSSARSLLNGDASIGPDSSSSLVVVPSANGVSSSTSVSDEM